MKHIRFESEHNPGMFVEVVLASRHPDANTCVYTLHMRYPRMIHAEVMTHRVFNRNGRSSRAVPVRKMLDEVRNNPFIPWHWTRNKPGMQGDGGWNEPVKMLGAAAQFVDASEPTTREAAWLWARDMACDAAESFLEAGYHKQIANRLLEPFAWMDTLVTATDWANFLWLRDHEDAEPHLRDLARLVRRAIETIPPHVLDHGEWHLPYVTEDDREWARRARRDEEEANRLLCQISAARCARISYKPFDGDAVDRERDLALYAKLVDGSRVHASPTEHQCKPDKIVTVETTYWDDERDGEILCDLSTLDQLHPNLAGPLRNFVQFRKLIPGEAIHG